MALSSCPITSGIARDCRDGSPGLTNVYAVEFSNYTQGTITAASGSITNVASFLQTGKKMWGFEFDYGKANETEVLTANTNGTLMNAITLNLYIPKKQAAVAQQILLLAKQDTIWMVKDKNGAFRLLGQEFGMRITTATAASGAMGNDDSGYTIVLTGEERTYANVVPNALAALLLIPA
jgi:hypothetical protein